MKGVMLKKIIKKMLNNSKYRNKAILTSLMFSQAALNPWLEK